MKTDLTTFLRFRLFEDQCSAENAQRDWPTGDDSDEIALQPDSIMVGAHLLRFNPTRMLGEVAYKWRIVVQYEGLLQEGGERNEATAAVLHTVLQAFALPYADHEDYQPEWAPTP